MYSSKREVVEEKISKWSGVNDIGYNEQKEKKPLANENNRNKSRENYVDKNDDREMWDAICKACQAKIKVPFKPDPARKTYCKECLADIRKQSSEFLKDKNNKPDNNLNDRNIQSEESVKDVNAQNDKEENRKEEKPVQSNNTVKDIIKEKKNRRASSE